MSTSSYPPTERQEDLLTAAAFGTLSEAERAEFEALLESSPELRAEYASLQALTADLALLAPEVDPPASLRNRLEQAITAETPAPKPVSSRDELIELSDQAGPIPINLSTRRSNPYAGPKTRLPSTVLWAAAAAVILALAAGILLDRMFLQDDDETSMQEIAFEVTLPDEDTAISGELMYDPDSQMFMLETENMPSAPEGQVYQVWLIDHEGVPQPKGVMDQSAFVVKADRSAYQTFAITMEPAPIGSAGPTSDPILVAPLSPATN